MKRILDTYKGYELVKNRIPGDYWDIVEVKFIPKREQVYISRCYQLLELKLLRENNIRAKEDNYLRYLINSNLAKMLYSMAETIIRSRNTNYYTKILLPNIGVFSSYIDRLETLNIVGLFKISFSNIDFKIIS